MVASLNFITLEYVYESWEALRKIPDYEQKVGEKLFEKLFTMEPEAKTLFGFKRDATIDEIEHHNKFRTHSVNFVKMFDKAIEMMGPDIELVTEILLDLGARHVSYGVKAEFFPSMGRCLINVLSEMLDKDTWNEEHEQAWYELYGAISYDMIRAQQKGKELMTNPDYRKQNSGLSR